VAYSGFSVGGVNWPRSDISSEVDPDRRLDAVRHSAAEDARLTHGLGGNLIRVFYSARHVLDGLVPGDDLDFTLGVGGRQAMHKRSRRERVEAVDRCAGTLSKLVTALEDGEAAELMNLSAIDAYVQGVEDFNDSVADDGDGVGILLTLVADPPRWIIEAPSAKAMEQAGRIENFGSLWMRYLHVHAVLHRELVRRYVGERVGRGQRPALRALEPMNEPDYTWQPEEVKLETASDELLYPLAKYVTELKLTQVPEVEIAAPPFELHPWGYQDQDGEWSVDPPVEATNVLDFNWSAKFDWYVKTFADYQQHVAEAIRDEAGKHGVDVDIVSASVTHNNIEYLARMHRANPRTFDATNKIGIHPYHWARNDVWDARFVDQEPMDGWVSTSPREYASSYFKRFDFLEQLAALIRSPRRAPRALRGFARAIAGKPIWITEFGVGAKSLGIHNAPIPELTRFIRPRREIGAAGDQPAAIWEDLWESFLSQVDGSYLDRNRIECLLIYSLRELGAAGFDLDDDDRSNFALLRQDGSPRMDEPTLAGIQRLLEAVSGRGETPAPAPRPGVELHSQPWREIGLPPAAMNVMTMLSEQERKLLFWLTEEYQRDRGAIVDAGCFVGGSTLALAEGLQRSPHGSRAGRIHVFDRFEVEPYMADSYFADRGLSAGESFRPLFDENTRGVSDLLTVHEGDLEAHPWPPDLPIEILFIDIAKSWELNDLVVRQFFPRLIPDRSVIVQQDCVFSLCPWVPITMEHYAEHFEPVAFVEANSVVYICRKAFADDADLPFLGGLDLWSKLRLIDAAIGRFKGVPAAILECAKAMLLLEGGDPAAARAHLSWVRDAYGDAQPIRTALEAPEQIVDSLAGA
jgi:hypothetical protein